MNAHAAAAGLVAHRGYPARYPENSLTGLAAAIASGARYVEFDVQLSADRVPVVFHDRVLDRVSPQGGSLLAQDWASLSHCTVGEPSRFGARHADEPLPRLVDVVALLERHPEVWAFVELKRASIERHGIEAVLDAVIPCLRPVAVRVSLISFHAEVLQQARLRSPLAIGWVFDAWDEAVLRNARSLAPDELFVAAGCVPAGTALPPGPWRWAVYETSDPAAARDWWARGAELVETDAIGEMLAALAGG